MKKINIMIIMIAVLSMFLTGCQVGDIIIPTKKPEDCEHLNKKLMYNEKDHYEICIDCMTEISREPHKFNKEDYKNTACKVCGFDPYQVGRETTYKYGPIKLSLYDDDVAVKYNGRITNIYVADDIVFIVCWSPYMTPDTMMLFDDSLVGKAYIPEECNSKNEILKKRTEDTKNMINSYANEQYSIHGDKYFEDQDKDGHINEVDMFIQSMFEKNINYWGIYSFSI